MSALGDLLRGGATVGRGAFNFTQHGEVEMSADLERILALPRRPQVLPPPGVLGKVLKTPGGQMSLRPIQEFALLEAQQRNGLFAPIGVGEGKTLITLLLPTVMGSRRAVLMVPPQLREQLRQRSIPDLAPHWRIKPVVGDTTKYPDSPDGLIYIVAYSELSSAKGADALDRIKPDLIILDEAHALKSTSAARTKRFRRYFNHNPGTRLCALSGTITSKSIKDFAHIAKLALGAYAPVPLEYPVLEEWSWALDPIEFPTPPGALLKLCEPGESVRSGFRRRLVETPGVVASGENRLGTSLRINERVFVVPKDLSSALDDMRKSWCTPGGEEITDALSFSRYARQLASGFYYRWIWPRKEPEPVRKEWLEARKEWHREVRRFLTHSARAGMDSPLLLAQAAAKGRWPAQHWSRWAAARDTARPEVEAVWISDAVVADAIYWGETNFGIIWSEHEAVSQKIAECGAFPLYGGGVEASAGILGERGNRTIVASRRAHGEGKNLQMFSGQLVVTPSSSGKTWEQLLGRTHRTGQQADEVTCDVYAYTPEMKDALVSAVRDAKFIQEALGTQQRLTYADFTFEFRPPKESK